MSKIDFNSLSVGDNVIAEYIWIGGYLKDLRSKTKVIPGKTSVTLEDLPIWNFDGSSTNQAPGNDSEVLIVPRAIQKDPFRGEPHVLVLCDTWKGSNPDIPTITNFRADCNKLMTLGKQFEPWFGIEQEYTLMDTTDINNLWPLGWPKGGQPAPQGPFYTSVGAENNFGRSVADNHIKACLHAGITMSGLNSEVMPGQWEFQVGPCEGIKMGDDLYMARQILIRVAELENIAVSFDPKPIKGDWNGSGCHTNQSTKETRENGGYTFIKTYLGNLSQNHLKHIKVYGSKNNERLTGQHETASIREFTWGVANRGASCRVPRETERNDKGYFEDRRPASNCCPYLVTAVLVDTTILGGTKEYKELENRITRDSPEFIQNL